MRAAAPSDRRSIAPSLAIFCALAALTISLANDTANPLLPPLVIAVVLFAVAPRALTSWSTLLAAIVLIILFVPIRRYTMAANLPFEPEPYRLLVALVMIAWLAALLVDPRVRLRKTGLEWPLALIAVTAVLSVLTNAGRVGPLETEVVKKLTFFASFLLLVYLVVSVVRTFEQVEGVIKVLVGGGTLVAALAIFEARSGVNIFDHLSDYVPFLHLAELPDVPGRGARLRVYASAQHPIALSAMFVMLVPLAVYLARTQGRRLWWLAAGVLALGTLSTVSRTSIVMLAVVGVVFVWLRPREMKRLWPALIPLVLAVHVALPGTIGSLKESFFPPGGLVAEQQSLPGYRGSGRLADVQPALDEWGREPILGQGFGTRVLDVNADILDNQWLSSLIETGAVGVFAWLWLFFASVRSLGSGARRDLSKRGWLLAALAGSIAAYAVGMFMYDAFSFIQVTFLLFVLLGLGAAVLRLPPGEVASAGVPAGHRVGVKPDPSPTRL